MLPMFHDPERGLNMWERLVYQPTSLAQAKHFASVVDAGFWTNRKGFHRANIHPGTLGARHYSEHPISGAGQG